MRITKESFKRISEVYRFLMDKINVEESKEGFQTHFWVELESCWIITDTIVALERHLSEIRIPKAIWKPT